MATSPPPSPHSVNLFRPRPGYMRQRVVLMWILLAGWLVFTLGFQLLLYLAGRNAQGESWLTETIFFSFPFHSWFSGHFLIVWFMFLCLVFNVVVDRLNEKHRRRK